MDLDLLKKLVQLANHNSSEHEANSAARKVCRLLEESKFVINISKPVTPPIYPKYGKGSTINVKPPAKYKDEYSKEEREYDEKINAMYDSLLKDEPR